MAWFSTSRHSRGYDARWTRTRKRILQRDNGLCQCDQCQGGDLRVTRATDVHHIRGRAEGGTDDDSNLISLGPECHKRIEAIKQGRTIKPKVIIGLDGYPL